MSTSTPSREERQKRSTEISDTLDWMRKSYLPHPDERIYFKIPDARQVLYDYFEHFVSVYHRNFVWLPEYEKIAEWLSDNEGLGLFMYGNNGRGKSFLGRYVLPAILLRYAGKIVRTADVQEMNRDIETMLNRKVISIDDVGTEEILNHYGNKRLAFAEIMDAVEKHEKLIIVSTNLNDEQIADRYGDRVLDRIIATTRRVLFSGESMRRRILPEGESSI